MFNALVHVNLIVSLRHYWVHVGSFYNVFNLSTTSHLGRPSAPWAACSPDLNLHLLPGWSPDPCQSSPDAHIHADLKNSRDTQSHVSLLSAPNFGNIVLRTAAIGEHLTCLFRLSLFWSIIVCLFSILRDTASFSPPHDQHPQIPNPCSSQDSQDLPVDTVRQRCAIDRQDLVPFLYGAFLGCHTWWKHLVNLRIRHSETHYKTENDGF